MENKFLKLYNIIMEELNPEQKRITQLWASYRKKTLSFGPMFKEERTYFPVATSALPVLTPPKEVLEILDNADYYCPDYRQKYVYKKSDKLKSKPVKLLTVIEKELKADPEKFSQIKKNFDERLKTSRKENIKCLICITHNPYDVAGMSTDRNWTSCMNLDTGAYKETPLYQVTYGGMCAYLIKETDKEIEEPIARIAIKRLEGTRSSRKFIFLPENRTYGDNEFAEELNFAQQVAEILKESNEKTIGDEILLKRNDSNSYSDANITNFINGNSSKAELEKFKEFLETHPRVLKKINWEELSWNKDLSNNFILTFYPYLDFQYVFDSPQKDEKFLEEIMELLDEKHLLRKNMRNLLYSQQVPERLIRQYIDYFTDPDSYTYELWETLSHKQRGLSKEFLIEYMENLDWQKIFANYPKSMFDQKFLEKYWEQLYEQDQYIFNSLLWNIPVSEKLFLEMHENCGCTPVQFANYILNNQEQITPEFLKTYEDNIDWKRVSQAGGGFSVSKKVLTEKLKELIKPYLDKRQLTV
jgi:hypothetical protein